MQRLRILVCLVVVTTIAACGDSSEDAATTTTTAVPTSTSSTAVPATCSASSLDADVSTDATLPAPVATMRADIARAAVACDYEELAALADRDGEAVRFTFGAETDPVAFWRDAEGSADRVLPLRALRVLLDLEPAATKGGGFTTYVWPAAFASEHPTDAQLSEIASTGLYDMATLRGWVASGTNYLGYRLMITDRGDWTLFVTGD
jgi:hypothetical protein